GLVPEESPGGDTVDEPDESGVGLARAPARVPHLQHFALACAERLDDDADEGLGDVDDDLFVGLEELAVGTAARDGSWPRDRELVPFAPHRLHEDPEVELPSTRDGEGVGGVGVLDPERDVALELPVEALAELPARDEAAFAPGEGG